MNNYVSVTFTDTQPDPRRVGGRMPCVAFVDVSDMAVHMSARAGMPAYSGEQRVQFALNVLRVMGIEPRPDMRPIVNGKRGLANRGFTVTVWVR